MRGELERIRARSPHVSFERAWQLAWERVRWPDDTDQRRTWKDVLLGHKEAWEDAYLGMGIPPRGVTEIAASLIRDDNGPAL